MNVVSRIRFTLCAVAAAAVISGCGGSPQSTALPAAQPQSPSSTAQTGYVQMTLKNGAVAASSARRNAQFLSVSAKSVSIVTNGGAPVILNLGSCSTNTAGSGNQCAAVGFSAPAGSDTFVVTAFDGGSGSGNVLGSGTVAAVVTAGQTTPVGISLGGSVANINLILSNYVPATGTAATIALSSVSNDADGSTIIGTYTNPITISISDPSNTTTLGGTTLGGSSATVMLSYNGGAVTTPVVITGTTTNAAAKTITGTVTLAPGGKFPQLVDTNFQTGTPYCGVDVYDASGTGAVSPKVLLRGSGANNACLLLAVAPNGDVALGSSANGIYLWHGYASSNPYFGFGAYGGPTSMHYDKNDKLYLDNVTNPGTALVSITVYPSPITGPAYPLETVDIPSQYENYTTANFKNATSYVFSVSDPQGNLWVSGSDGIDEFSIVNGASTKLAGISYGSTIKGVQSMAFGPSGELWVCDPNTNELIKIAPGATTADSPATVITGTYASPCYAVHVDSMGSVYLLTNNNTINVFASNAPSGATLPTRVLQLKTGAADFDLNY